MHAYLNLSEGFRPKRYFDRSDYVEVPYKYFEFSGGEPHIRIGEIDRDGNWKVDASNWDVITITHRIRSFNDMGKLIAAVNALRQPQLLKPGTALRLFVPYFPGARQDRVANIGEALTVKMYADLINMMKFDYVAIVDGHSDVASAVINNCNDLHPYRFYDQCIDFWKALPSKSDEFAIAIPDFGATKKIQKAQQGTNMQNKASKLIQCTKLRDTVTGKLTGFDVFVDDLQGKDVFILDDICDGGGTFLGLAKKLKEKNSGNLYLATTHGIYSKGCDILTDEFNVIFCTNSFRDLGEAGRGKNSHKVIQFAVI